jgi:GR25 family glycosyltransferase involved in LPS biosynthesis
VNLKISIDVGEFRTCQFANIKRIGEIYTMVVWNFYIISLKEATDRRQHVENLRQRLQNFGNVHIIDAYYYKSCDVLEILQKEGVTYADPNRGLALSQVGTFLSHRAAWKLIYSGATDELHVVLEDDMELGPEFSEQFEAIRELEEFTERPEALVFWKHPEQIPANFKHVSPNFVQFYNQWSLCAYSPSRDICKKMLDLNSLDISVDLLVYRDVFSKAERIFFSKENMFVNLGFLAGTNAGPAQFKSWIWA